MWKKSIDDVKIICKKCGVEMINESSRNMKDGIFVCPKCKEHILLGVKDGKL